jgi:hypothetical protein
VCTVVLIFGGLEEKNVTVILPVSKEITKNKTT